MLFRSAIEKHQKDGAPNEELLDYVAFYALSPDRPTNLRTTALADDPQDPNKQQFTIKWDAPTTKYNGHPLDNLLGYFIEYTQDFISWHRLNTEPHTTTEFIGTVPNGETWFIVLAVDTERNVSSPSPDMYLELTSEQPLYDLCHYNLTYYA